MKYLLILVLLLIPAVCQAQYRGDVPLGETLNFTFNTVGQDGAPITIAGTPAIEVYEEGDTTQITAGTTLTEDFDSVTGLHNVAIVATSGNGYEAGKWYDIVIAGTTPTADSVSILGRTIGQFRVVAAENVAGVATSDIDYVGGVDEATALATADELGTNLATGTAQSGTSTTVVLAASSAFADDVLNYNRIKITGGTGAGQSRLITDYVGASDTATVSPAWAVNPSSDSTYEVVEGSTFLDLFTYMIRLGTQYDWATSNGTIGTTIQEQ